MHACMHACAMKASRDLTRDFDLLGYKYSLLSTIGTAGLPPPRLE